VRLVSSLETERHLPKIQRRTARRLFEGMVLEGYRRAYDSAPEARNSLGRYPHF